MNRHMTVHMTMKKKLLEEKKEIQNIKIEKYRGTDYKIDNNCEGKRFNEIIMEIFYRYIYQCDNCVSMWEC